MIIHHSNYSVVPFFDFLKTLAANNNREWFAQHRDDYEVARAEVLQILEACISEVAKFEDLGQLKAKETMFRIYRDVRFSKNKDPFKLNFSAMISANGKKAMSGFAYYIHFQPNASFLAAGMYEPKPEELAKMRQEIDYNTEAFKKIIYEPSFVSLFGKMKGKQLKTSPKGYPKDHPEIELLRYTQFYFSLDFADAEVLSPEFPEKLANGCLKLRPFLEFLQEASH